MSTFKQIFNISNKVTRNSTAIYRNSHRRCSVRKGILRNFEKSQENTCAYNFIKIEALAQVFRHEFCEISNYVWATASKYKEIFYAFDLKNKIFAVINFSFLLQAEQKITI